MFKIFKKIVWYSFLMLLALELLVRLFHLQNERPLRFADEKGVEKWISNQEEYSITGNRKQNVGKYHINDFGFNSVHKAYNPKEDKFEIALVGDSFIEGFHEDYTNSLGQQVEKGIKGSTVLEFGYAGYDLADELHLIQSYSSIFDKIDHTFVYLRYSDDLDRDKFEPSSRLSLDSPLSRIVKHIKLLVYLKDIGALDPLIQLPGRIKGLLSVAPTPIKSAEELENEAKVKDELSLKNFKRLLEQYPIAKNKYTFLLDRDLCSQEFLMYLDQNGYKTLDLGKALENSKEATTLVYDQHWSQHGRKLIAELIMAYIQTNKIGLTQ